MQTKQINFVHAAQIMADLILEQGGEIKVLAPTQAGFNVTVAALDILRASGNQMLHMQADNHSIFDGERFASFGADL